MLVYNMDVERRSVWRRTTPGAAALDQPYRCTEAGLFYANAHFSTARTDKESYIIFYTISGAGLIEQNGLHVTLQPGQALMMNCRTAHSYCTDPAANHWHHYWAHIDGAGVASMEPILNPQHISPISLPGLDSAGIFDELLQHIEEDNTMSVLRQSLRIHNLLSLLAQQTLDNTEDASNRALMQNMADYIRSHFADPLNLDTLVGLAHISKSYFLRLFRQYMGTTPYNYLVCYRITRAKEFLITTDLPVSAIAHRTGFANEANFSFRFSTVVGQSPLQYRLFSRTSTPAVSAPAR